MWPWLSNHIRVTFKPHVVQGQWLPMLAFGLNSVPPNWARCSSPATLLLLAGVPLGLQLGKALPLPFLPGEILLAHKGRCWLAVQRHRKQSQECAENRLAESIIQTCLVSKSALCHFRRKDLDKGEDEETAGKMQFHLPSKLPLHQLPTAHQGTSLASFPPSAILKSNLLYTNTEVNIIHWAAVQRADCTKLVKRHCTNRPLRGTARPGPHCIDWTCYSTSSSTVLVPEGAVLAQAQHNHTCVAHCAHRANTAFVCIHFCRLTQNDSDFWKHRESRNALI